MTSKEAKYKQDEMETWQNKSDWVGLREQSSYSMETGTIKRIVVNKHHVKHNLRHKRKKPVISVQTSKGPVYADEVEIRGPSKMVYSPNKPLKCGATVWIETSANIFLKGHKWA